jgi:hypothetical protein
MCSEWNAKQVFPGRGVKGVVRSKEATTPASNLAWPQPVATQYSVAVPTASELLLALVRVFCGYCSIDIFFLPYFILDTKLNFVLHMHVVQCPQISSEARWSRTTHNLQGISILPCISHCPRRPLGSNHMAKGAELYSPRVRRLSASRSNRVRHSTVIGAHK